MGIDVGEIGALKPFVSLSTVEEISVGGDYHFYCHFVVEFGLQIGFLTVLTCFGLLVLLFVLQREMHILLFFQ